jgi:hypothetical protein
MERAPMPPQTNVYADAPQANQAKGLLGFIKSQAGASRRWIGQSAPWPTVRALGETRSSTNTRRAARRPVWE